MLEMKISSAFSLLRAFGPRRQSLPCLLSLLCLLDGLQARAFGPRQTAGLRPANSSAFGLGEPWFCLLDG